MNTPVSLKQQVIERLQMLNDDSTPAEIQEATSKLLNPASANPGIWQSSIRRSTVGVCFCAAIISIACSIIFKMHNVALILYAFWSLGPPCWFLYEYVFRFPANCKLNSHVLADFKYTQELAGKIWAGLLVVLTALILTWDKIPLK